MGIDASGTGGTRRLLEIYVAPDCYGGDTARRLAGLVGGLGLADLEVRLIDLSDQRAIRPPAVFAVPTYLLDGRVLCLGNPFEDWLVERLRSGEGEGVAATGGGGAA